MNFQNEIYEMRLLVVKRKSTENLNLYINKK